MEEFKLGEKFNLYKTMIKLKFNVCGLIKN